MPLLATLSVLACSTAVYGQTHKYFPGEPLDQRTMRAQERVEELYDSGEYSRAFLIYQKELAPKGDKYAQYMVGYMYLAGKSVPSSKPQALAWYRLAAERGEPAIVQARDALYQQMTPEEIAQSNQIYVDLLQRIGDNRLLLDLVRKDLDILRARTGTRIPASPTGHLTIINSNGAGAERFYQSVRERIRTRLDYLQTSVDITDVDAQDNIDAVRSLETEMRKELAALEAP